MLGNIALTKYVIPAYIKQINRHNTMNLYKFETIKKLEARRGQKYIGSHADAIEVCARWGHVSCRGAHNGAAITQLCDGLHEPLSKAAAIANDARDMVVA